MEYFTYANTFRISTRGFTDIINISPNVIEIVKESGLYNGSALVFCPSSTSGITTIEYESGCIEDLKRYFEAVAPQNFEYLHNLKWGDGNGFSHLRSAITSPSFTFPVLESEAILGDWQQIIFIDFDNSPRQRDIIVQVYGER